MGTLFTSENENENEFETFMKDYKLLGDKNLSKLYNLEIFINKKDNQKIIIKYFKVYDKLEKEMFEKEYKFITENNRFWFHISNYFIIKKEGLCINTEDVAIVYRYLDDNLYDNFLNSISLIKNKVEKIEFDMILTIRNITNILNKASKENIFIHDIKPELIFINKNKDVKFFHEITIENKNLEFYVNKIIKNELLAYSPELWEEINYIVKNNRSKQYNINWDKSSIFSLGISILSILSKLNLKSFYNLPEFELKNKLLKSSFNNISLNYFSEFFVNILKQMIDINVKNRVSSKDLLNLIEKKN